MSWKMLKESRLSIAVGGHSEEEATHQVKHSLGLSHHYSRGKLCPAPVWLASAAS
jgi:hypothetical protein